MTKAATTRALTVVGCMHSAVGVVALAGLRVRQSLGQRARSVSVVEPTSILLRQPCTAGIPSAAGLRLSQEVCHCWHSLRHLLSGCHKKYATVVIPSAP